YRLMAKDAIDQIDLLFSQRNECTTHSHKLAGGADYQYDSYKKLADQYNLPVDVCQHLVKKYGSRAEQVCLLTAHEPHLKDRIAPAHCFIKAEVVYTVRNEMVMTPRDFLARRTRLEIIDWKATLAALPEVADLMARELSWTSEQTSSEVLAYQQIIHAFMTVADMPA
ncbi:MAG TPA: glycerol-3-phosphate dehydrogenase C-terminal domain-containing protein, partial [Dyadobacter sp.]|nr:glycerol-3-phosphate dehydrogenase C-terminal domain-containing protein [Dyadobacter sp.]